MSAGTFDELAYALLSSTIIIESRAHIPWANAPVVHSCDMFGQAELCQPRSGIMVYQHLLDEAAAAARVHTGFPARRVG